MGDPSRSYVSVRDLDRDTDVCRAGVGVGEEPRDQRIDSAARVLEFLLAEDVAVGVENAGPVRLGPQSMSAKKGGSG